MFKETINIEMADVPGVPGLAGLLVELETGITVRPGSSIANVLNPSEAGVCLAVHHFLGNVFSRIKLAMLTDEDQGLEATFTRMLRELENAAALYTSEVFNGEHHRPGSTPKEPADWNAQFAEMIKGMRDSQPKGE